MSHSHEIPGELSWQATFLESLSETGNVSEACRLAEIPRHQAYRERKRSETFAAAWQEALEIAVDHLEDEARARAVQRSDTLLMFLLKAHRPEKYRDRAESPPAESESSFELSPAQLADPEVARAAAELLACLARCSSAASRSGVSGQRKALAAREASDAAE